MKTLEEELEDARQKARSIAHDFNNVLAAILGCAELVSIRLKPDDPLRGELDEIRKAAGRGTDLTRELRNLIPQDRG
jgi:signal transduction histidine kinase